MFFARAQPLFQDLSSDVLSLYLNISILLLFLTFASICYFLITRFKFLNILSMFIFLFCKFHFYFVYSVIFIVLCFVSPLIYSCPSHIAVQVYRPLPPCANTASVNNYHIVSYHIISYHKTENQIHKALFALYVSTCGPSLI